MKMANSAHKVHIILLFICCSCCHGTVAVCGGKRNTLQCPWESRVPPPRVPAGRAAAVPCRCGLASGCARHAAVNCLLLLSPPCSCTFLWNGSTALLGILFSPLKWNLPSGLCTSWCSTWFIFIVFCHFQVLPHFWVQSHFPRGTFPVFILVISALLGFKIIKLTSVVSCWKRCWATYIRMLRDYSVQALSCAPLILFLSVCIHSGEFLEILC